MPGILKGAQLDIAPPAGHGGAFSETEEDDEEENSRQNPGFFSFYLPVPNFSTALTSASTSPTEKGRRIRRGSAARRRRYGTNANTSISAAGTTASGEGAESCSLSTSAGHLRYPNSEHDLGKRESEGEDQKIKGQIGRKKRQSARERIREGVTG